MRITGGIPVGGNLGVFTAGGPSFQINPRSPFKGMPQEELNRLKEWDQKPEDLQKYYERINSPGPQLPFASVGNVGALLAQAKPTWQEIMDRGTQQSWTDIPGRARMRQDAMQAPYDPGNYAENDRSNPLRNYRWPYGAPEGLWMQPSLRPYFGRYQGPGLQGELGTGAI